MMRHHAAAVRACVLALIAFSTVFMSAQAPSQPGSARLVPEALRARAERNGRVRVIVELKLPGGGLVAECQLPSAIAIATQRREIANSVGRVTSRLSPADRRIIHRFATVPFLALEVNARALAALESSSADIVRVVEDEVFHPVLA